MLQTATAVNASTSLQALTHDDQNDDGDGPKYHDKRYYRLEVISAKCSTSVIRIMKSYTVKLNNDIEADLDRFWSSSSSC